MNMDALSERFSRMSLAEIAIPVAIIGGAAGFFAWSYFRGGPSADPHPSVSSAPIQDRTIRQLSRPSSPRIEQEAVDGAPLPLGLAKATAEVKEKMVLPKVHYLLPNVLVGGYPGDPIAKVAEAMHASLVLDEGITHVVSLMQEPELLSSSRG